MAPISIPDLVVRASTSSNKSTYYRPVSGGAIGGGTIGGIIGFMAIVFFIALIYEYNKASKSRPLTTPPTPLPTGSIFKNAFLTAITLGFVACCCAECYSSTSAAPNTTTAQGTTGGDGYVPQQPMAMPTPMAMPKENMNWQPLQDVAQDKIQGGSG